MSKVSVIMSVYNGEKYLKIAIESILNQTFENFEFIIINDGSTDKTEDIIKKFMRKDERICLINNERNVERAESRNKGIKLSKGKYIAMMDADDISLPQRLEKEIKFLDNNPKIGLVGSWQQIKIDENNEFLGINQFPTTDKEIKKRLITNNKFFLSSIMLRKECIEKVGGFREEFIPAEDYDMWLRISEEYEVANIPEPLAKYRTYFNSSSVQRKWEQERYAQLVRELAKERRELGEDSLQIGDKSKINKILKDLSSLSWIEKRRFTANTFYGYGSYLFYNTNSKKRVKKWIKRALLFYPFVSLNAWRILAKCYLPSSVVEMIKKVKNRWCRER